ncbi:MAG: lipid A deacylase LpxR family protein [Candidatus Aminicenantes bacterium]|nr:lipid A deacylase LpxR family protein [Candidatus Aminicenantes bacterium]
MKKRWFPFSDLYALLLCLNLLFISGLLYSDTISIAVENDFFAGTDMHYTNGIRIGWLGNPLKGSDIDDASGIYPGTIRNAVKIIPFLSLNEGKSYNVGFSVYQMMFTPEDITKTEPDYNDIPYAGHLLFSFFLFEHDEHSYSEFKFQLGIVGPASGAGTAQRTFHKLIGAITPEGWDTQLENHATFGIAYEHGIRKWEKSYKGGFSSDLIGNVGFHLGNFYSGASLGSAWRFGKNYPKNFNVYYSGIINENALLGLQRERRGFGWSVNFGLFVDVIAYLYITDAASDYNINRGYFLGRAVVSLSFYLGNFQLSVTKQFRTSLASSQGNTLSFGAVSLLWKF